MDYNNMRICLDVFSDHWQQVLYFINNTNDQNSLETIFKHIDVMISIIIKECDEEENLSLEDILDYCNENSIFQTIFNHFIDESLLGENKEFGIINQLKMYDNLINFLPCKHLMRPNFMSAILHLLEECSVRSSVKIENLSVRLLYQLTVLITREPRLFDYVKHISEQEFGEPFYFIGLIIQLIHRDKDIGRLSQEALLLIFNFTKDDDSDLVDYICYRSDFSAILVTGLSGLYSSFPRKLENISDDWQQITVEFINTIPELKHSLVLLDFCNLALKMSHQKIQMDILEFLYTGFLSPVIGPSLHQNSLEETISATAYLELYMRHLHQPLLIKLFLQFILTERQENYVVLDSLINRLNSITMLGVITLSLFRTMLSFHSEDVVFSLIFRYLIPGDHLIKQKWIHLTPSSSEEDVSYNNCEERQNYKCNHRKQTTMINEDLSSSAEQFLKLSLGIYSEDQNTESILSASNRKIDAITLEQRRASQSPVVINNLQRFSMCYPFHSYLHSAALHVNRRILASNTWRFNYDGISPSTKIFEEINHSFDQWNQRFRFSHHIRESKETIIKSYIPTETDYRGSNESPAEYHTPLNPVKDVGYFSSNNGSGSTISNRIPYPIEQEQVTSVTDYSESKLDLLCQPPNTSELYKLHFYNFDAQQNDLSDHDEVIENSVENEDEVSVKLKSSVDETENINVQNVLLSTDSGCSLSDFLVSLDLLDIHENVDWNVNWEDVTLLLEQHEVEDHIECTRSTLTSISPVENFEENYESGSRSTPTNEVIFKRRLQSFDQSMHSSPHISIFSVTLGPFLSAIFQRLSALPTNTFFMNLLITGIITDLAAYPHPLIKSLLLDVDIILQPHINKLYEILSDIKANLLERSSNFLDWESILVNAYEYLYSRLEMNFIDGFDLNLNYEDEFECRISSNPTSASINSSFFDFDNFPLSRKLSQSSPTKTKDKTTRRTPFGILKRKKKENFPLYRFPIQKFCYVKKKPITEYEAQSIRNLAYNWILFDEFCKELASLCQEHTQHCFF